MTEYAAPFSGTTIATSQQYRDRYRPTQPDMIDDSYGGTALVVSNAANVNVNIANGAAVVQGASYALTAGPHVLPVAANGGGSNRFDIVCLTYDGATSPGVRLRTIQGVAGSGLPALTRSLTGIWDCPIAHYEKQPGGNLVNLVDRRHFSDGSGGIIGASVSWAPLAPQRIGASFLEWSTGRSYVWDGAAWVLSNSIGGWTTYTPTWSSTGTQPALGNGSIAGRYAVLPNKTIAFSAHLVTGGTSTYGTGNFRLSTPPGFNARTTEEQCVNAKAFDSSAGLAYIAQGNLGTGGVCLIQGASGASGVLQSMNATTPFTFATGDHLRCMGVYEYA